MNEHPDVVAGVVAIVQSLIEKRDDLTAAIEGLQKVYGLLPSAADVLLEPAPKTKRAYVRRGGKRPRKLPGAKPTKRKYTRRIKSDASVSAEVTARDNAILGYLSKHEFARSAELEAALPKEDGQTDDTRASALRNCLQRLRTKGAIGRTGDTWSLSRP